MEATAQMLRENSFLQAGDRARCQAYSSEQRLLHTGCCLTLADAAVRPYLGAQISKIDVAAGGIPHCTPALWEPLAESGQVRFASGSWRWLSGG